MSSVTVNDGDNAATPPFIQNVLTSAAPNGYVAENGFTLYVDESGLVFYVQET